MKVEVIIPKEVIEIISRVGNITKQKSSYKIYNALLMKSKYSNKHGWFEVSSRYLHKINGRYSTIINHFIDNDILEIHKKEYLTGLFTSVHKKSYCTKSGTCMRYRFKNIDITDGEVVEIEFENPNTDKRWYKVLTSSLDNIGYKTKITRDSYGGRVYHDLISDYKNELHKRGFCTIDAETSQPRLLYLMMKKKGIVDRKYFDIFESSKDFYLELVSLLGLKDRDEAKDIFMFWALGNGYTKGYKMNLFFPNVCTFLKNLKSKNYKDSARALSFRESRIFIDDLLNNIPVSFGIPIHDCLIVRIKDANKVLSYCEEKYPELKFKVEEI